MSFPAMVSRQPCIQFVLLDHSGTTTRSRYYVRRGVSIAAGLAAATGLRGTVAALSGCEFVSQELVFGQVEPRPAEPLAEAQLETCALLVYGCATPGERLVVVVPALRPDVVAQEGPLAGVVLDPASPAVAGLTAALVGVFCNPFGAMVAQLEAAYTVTLTVM